MDIQNLYHKYRESGKVSTDTRKVTPGSMFFALKGDTFNANEFAHDALTKGASYAIIDDENFAVNDRCIVVDEVLETLQKLARHHRDQFKIPIIGLTGSNGKTTTKELLKCVLSKKYKTFATQGNLNNHIGVPLSILSIDADIEIAIIEMGANHVGEIALLSAIANPTHGFITNIGKAHIGTFGGFDNIIRGKSELYQHLILHDGVVFINSQSPILYSMAKRFKNPLFYPAVNDFYHCEFLRADPFVKIKSESGEEISTRLAGGYNFENIAVALCVGKYFEVESTLAHQAISDYVPDNMRSQIIEKGTNKIMLDAYNANPSSMVAAIQTLYEMSAKYKVAILGDMFELEDQAEEEHQAIGRLLADKKFNEVYLCGGLMKSAFSEIPNAYYFETKEELLKVLRKRKITESAILIKASRGIGLEAVMDAL